MLSRRLLATTRGVHPQRQLQLQCSRRVLLVRQAHTYATPRASVPLRQLRRQSSPLPLVHVRTYVDTVVKVPQMAESISEGTLKQWSKQIGDYVEQDEEIATIETDKIDVAVNAPEAGTIKEFLANEEDTVTVGQDLVRIEVGGAPAEGGSKAEPKDSKAQDDSGAPPPEKKPEPESKPEPKQEKSESKPAPPPEKKDTPPPPKPSSQPPKESSDAKAPAGSREERRVRFSPTLFLLYPLTLSKTGQDEPHASPHRRAIEAVPEHRCFTDNIQRG